MPNPHFYLTLAKKTGGASAPPMTNLKAWWNPASVNNGGGITVASWSDATGHGWTLTNANNVHPPLRNNSLNGLTVVTYTCDTTTHGSVCAGLLTGMTAGEIYILLRTNSAGSCNGFWGWPISNQPSLYPWTDGKIYDGFMTTVRKGPITPGITLSNWHCYNAISTSSEWTDFENFTQVFTTATNTVQVNDTPRLADSSFGFIAGIDVAEILFYSAKLGSTDRATVRSYLNTKYALSL